MKFIICADARTGSHMLQSALNNHPDITCYGEILNPGSKDSFLQNRTPLEAIHYAFDSSPNVGFIIHRHRDLPLVWKYLQSRTDILVLFTDRLNHIRRYASYKIARKTKQFIDFKGNETTEKVAFDLDEYISGKNAYLHRLRDKAVQFGNHRSLMVTYELLLNNQHKFNTICRFLKVNTCDFRPLTKQQEQRTLIEIFSNYKKFENILKDYE